MVPFEQRKPSSIPVPGFCCVPVPVFPSVQVKTQQRLDIERLKVLSQHSSSPGEVLMHTKAPRPERNESNIGKTLLWPQAMQVNTAVTENRPICLCAALRKLPEIKITVCFLSVL